MSVERDLGKGARDSGGLRGQVCSTFAVTEARYCLLTASKLALSDSTRFVRSLTKRSMAARM